MKDSVLTAERFACNRGLGLAGSMRLKSVTKRLISYPQPPLLQVHPRSSLQSPASSYDPADAYSSLQVGAAHPFAHVQTGPVDSVFVPQPWRDSAPC